MTLLGLKYFWSIPLLVFGIQRIAFPENWGHLPTVGTFISILQPPHILGFHWNVSLWTLSLFRCFDGKEDRGIWQKIRSFRFRMWAVGAAAAKGGERLFGSRPSRRFIFNKKVRKGGWVLSFSCLILTHSFILSQDNDISWYLKYIKRLLLIINCCISFD